MKQTQKTDFDGDTEYESHILIIEVKRFSVVLITLTGNLSWLYTSDIKRLWLRVFLIFMIRTMAASI